MFADRHADDKKKKGILHPPTIHPASAIRTMLSEYGSSSPLQNPMLSSSFGRSNVSSRLPTISSSTKLRGYIASILALTLSTYFSLQEGYSTSLPPHLPKDRADLSPFPSSTSILLDVENEIAEVPSLPAIFHTPLGKPCG